MHVGVCRDILTAYKLLGFKLCQKNSLKPVKLLLQYILLQCTVKSLWHYRSKLELSDLEKHFFGDGPIRTFEDSIEV